VSARVEQRGYRAVCEDHDETWYGPSQGLWIMASIDAVAHDVDSHGRIPPAGPWQEVPAWNG